MSRFFHLLSVLFHPIFFPLYSVFVLFQLPIYNNYRFSATYFYFIYLIISLNLIVIPLLFSIYLKKKRVISSLKMELVEERRIPYLLSALLYVFTYFLLSQIDFPSLYLSIFAAATMVVSLLFLFTLAGVKVSAHLSAIGSFCGMIFVLIHLTAIDISLLLLVSILLAGLIGTARLALRAHRPLEVLLGFCLGLACQLLVLV